MKLDLVILDIQHPIIKNKNLLEHIQPSYQ